MPKKIIQMTIKEAIANGYKLSLPVNENHKALWLWCAGSGEHKVEWPGFQQIPCIKAHCFFCEASVRQGETTCKINSTACPALHCMDRFGSILRRDCYDKEKCEELANCQLEENYNIKLY